MAIQFKRGSYSNKIASTEILKAGQPFFEKTNKKLYIGDGSTQLKNLTAINNYTDTNQTISATVDGTTKYFLSNAAVNLKEGTDISFIVANNTTSSAPSLTINAAPYTAGNSLTLLDHQFNVTIAMNGGLEYSKGNDIKLKATTTTKTGTNEYNLQLDDDGTPYVSVPWSDTTYTAGTGLTLNGTTFSLNTGYDVPIEYKSSASSTAGFTPDKLYLIGTWTEV